jgi:hypothetical protein
MTAKVVNLNALTAGDGFRIVGESGSSGEYDLGDGAGVVRSAGDFNRDGFEDFIVGAPYATGTATEAGRAYLIFGTAKTTSTSISLTQLDGKNGFKLTGTFEDQHLGYSVAGADVNGDGFSDLVVSTYSYYYDYDGEDYYRTLGDGVTNISAQQVEKFDGDDITYIIYGRKNWTQSSINLDALNKDSGVTIDGFAGYVRAVDNTSRDRPDDIIIGDYLIFGSRKLPGNFSPDIDGNDGLDLKGVSGEVGDINGDGFKDFASAYGDYLYSGDDDEYGPYAYIVEGASFILYGSKNLKNASKSKVKLDNAGSDITVGDINGDGFSDVVIYDRIPSSEFHGIPKKTGNLYFLFGDNKKIKDGDISKQADLKISGVPSDYYLDTLTADMNGDGRADLILSVSEFRYDSATEESSGGHVNTYVIYGAKKIAKTLGGSFAGLVQKADMVIGGHVEGGFHSISAADFNGDGSDDLIFGDTAGANGAGISYVVYGTPAPGTLKVKGHLSDFDGGKLNFVSVDVANKFFDGQTKIGGDLRFISKKSDKLVDVKLEITIGASVISAALSDKGVKKLIGEKFGGEDGILKLDVSDRLFQFDNGSLAGFPFEKNGTVKLTVVATTKTGQHVEAEMGTAAIITQFELPRYGDERDSVQGGDNWVVPSIIPVLEYFSKAPWGLTYNDASNMNGGVFLGSKKSDKPHAEHKFGLDVDFKYPAFPAQPNTDSLLFLLDMINDDKYGKRIKEIYVSFNKEFRQAIEGVHLDETHGGALATTIIKNIAGHDDHYHFEILA